MRVDKAFGKDNLTARLNAHRRNGAGINLTTRTAGALCQIHDYIYLTSKTSAKRITNGPAICHPMCLRRHCQSFRYRKVYCNFHTDCNGFRFVLFFSNSTIHNFPSRHSLPKCHGPPLRWVHEPRIVFASGVSQFTNPVPSDLISCGSEVILFRRCP